MQEHQAPLKLAALKIQVFFSISKLKQNCANFDHHKGDKQVFSFNDVKRTSRNSHKNSCCGLEFS